MQRKDLKKFSPARIGLSTTGGLLTTNDWLDFQKGFLQAKDALKSEFNINKIQQFCQQKTIPTIELVSQADSLKTFLLRPDLGRLLTNESENRLKKINSNAEILIILSGGLAPSAIEHHAIPFLTHFLLHCTMPLAPIMILKRSRVAIGDYINHFINAKMTMILIGSRPGLSSPNSLGIYFTPNAKPGCNDSQRICLSNIHETGMSYAEASAASFAILRKNSDV